MSTRKKSVPLSKGMRPSPAPKPTKYFTVKRSAIAGRGAFASRAIRKGSIVIEYMGYWVTPEEEEAHYHDDVNKDHHTFLFYIDKTKTLDATYNGNEARFINHSCDPNCETIIRNRRVYVKTLRPIEPGEELAYDYSYIFWGPLEKNWKSRYRCRCGAKKCRGFMLDPAMLKKALKGSGVARPAKKFSKKKTLGKKKRARVQVEYVR